MGACTFCECPVKAHGNMRWHWDYCPAVDKARDASRRGRIHTTSTPKKLYQEKRRRVREQIAELQLDLKTMRPPEKDTCLQEVHLIWIDYMDVRLAAA